MTTRARRFFLNEIAKQNREEKKKALRFLMTSLCLRSIDMQLERQVIYKS